MDNTVTSNEMETVFRTGTRSGDAVAASLVTHAFNRRASDNLAVTLLNVTALRTRLTETALQRSMSQWLLTASDASIKNSDDLNPGAVVKSSTSMNVYQLQDKIVEVPRAKDIHIPKPIQPRHLRTFEMDGQCQLLKESLEVNEKSLMLFRPMESSMDLKTASASSVPRSCVASYYLETIDMQLIRLLGAQPRQSALPSSSQRTLLTSTTTELFELHSRYRLQEKFAGGGFGEIWKAILQHGPKGEGYVLKRIKSEKGEDVLFSGLREAYFGNLFKQTTPQSNHLVRFVESFELDYGEELWLVFRDEGISLYDLMYTSHGDNEFKIVEPSEWWHQLRLSEDGTIFEKRLLHQLLTAVRLLHSRNVTHRDIKPENVLIEGHGVPDPNSFQIRLIDFGSAIDRFSMENYYGDEGPSEDEQTREYAPPEVLFEQLVYHPDLASHYYAYDMWSIGIIWLEWILGSPHIFEISSRTRVLMEKDLKTFEFKEEDKEKAYLLRAMMEFCIYPPGSFAMGGAVEARHGDVGLNASSSSLMAWSCTEASMMELIRSRDVHGIGIHSDAALRLLMSLLAWNPYERRTAAEALRNPIFKDVLQ